MGCFLTFGSPPKRQLSMGKMKGLILPLVALALLFGLASAYPHPNARAGVAKQLSVAETQDQDRDHAVKTFAGKIIKNDDKLVLQVDAISAPYQLDDQQRAAKFEGKKVKVTGTLDMANNLIRVQSIESVA
jgi:hypothetical protein